MNDIINIVRKSIERRFKIECGYGFISINNDNKKLDIILGNNCGNQVLVIRTTNNGRTNEIELCEKDLLEWKLLCIECNNYQNTVAIEDINKFLEEDSRPTTINDLDNEEDD